MAKLLRLILLFFALLPFATQAQEIVVSSLTFEGNKLTKERILLREITFREGQTIPKEKFAEHLERSKGNLWNLLLFNFVEIDTCSFGKNQIEVVVRVIERWYVWPIPFIEFADRNLSEWWETKRLDRLDYGTLVKWSNFRGRREELTLHLRFGFNNQYELRYQIPYLDKAQRWGIEFQGGYRQGREVAYATVQNKRVFYKSSERDIFGRRHSEQLQQGGGPICTICTSWRSGLPIFGC